MSPLLFFPLSDEEEERKHGRPSKEEAAMKHEFLVNFGKLSEVKDELLLHFIDR